MTPDAELKRDQVAPIADVLEAASSEEEAGRWDEALSIYHAALSEWLPQGGAPACELLRMIGGVHYYRGEYPMALDHFKSARGLASEAQLADELAEATNCLGVVQQTLGQLGAATELYLTAQSIAEEIGNTKLAVMVDQNLGIIANIRGDTAEALRRYQLALERYRALGDDLSAARALNNIGMVCVDTERWSDAEVAFDTALQQADASGDLETVGTVQLNRAELCLALGRLDDARDCCDQAFDIFTRIQSKSGLGETYKLYGMLYRDSGRPDLAEAHLEQVAELAQSIDDPLLEAEAEAEIAVLHLGQGRNKGALKSLNRAHRLFEDLEARRDLEDVERRLDRLEQTYLQVVQAWGDSIESKDRYTAGHCERVADYTCRLAEAIGIRGRELAWLRMGAFLHDVGKAKVDSATLNKPTGLDAREWEEMRRHTTTGDEIVAALDFPYDIRPMVRSHHERWDGRGYPDRLEGDEIPLIARILCIADVYDALTSTRSYRTAHSPEKALTLMSAESGRNFDPELFEVFETLMGPHGPADTHLSSGLPTKRLA